MIPILYAGNERNFLNNGLGRLSDAIKCTVTEERNGEFELEMTYPVTGIHYADIAENAIIYAKTEDGGNNQAFIIYKISRPLNGVVTINAQHISYLLNGFIVFPFTAVSLADAMSKIVANTTPASIPFTFNTDVSSLTSFKLESPRSVRNLLGGEQGSLLDTYGGYDYKFDNFTVSLLANRGLDRGVSIRYGKNLTGLKNVDDMTNLYTGIVPFWQGDNTSVYLTEKAVYCDYADNFPYKIIKTVDFSSEFETQPTQAQLRAKAQAYITNNKGWEIRNTIDVSFISLAQTEEYKDIAPLERVKMCDTVTIRYDKLGVNAKAKVIKTVYNVLLERYDSISLGSTTYTLAKAIQQAIDAPTTAETSSYIATAVEHATKLIQGGLGGHVVFNTDGNGEPQEILIMDTDDIATAQNVIRMNLNGIGFSHNGYNGPFETAWTIDGSFVADFITAGNLNGALVSAGTIQASALSLEAKEELGTVHSYIGDNIFSDISLWHHTSYITPYYETVGGKTYLVIDGTGISAFNADYRVWTPMDSKGDITVNINFKFHIDRQVTIAQQRFPYIEYVKTYGTISRSWRNISAQTIPANTDFEWNVTLSASEVDGDQSTVFGFYAIPQCKMYLEVLTVTSQIDVFMDSALQFTNRGLNLMVAEIAHNYLTYDIMSNASKWKRFSTGVQISATTYTYDHYTYDTILIDGTSVPQASDLSEVSALLDIKGKPKLNISYKYFIDRNESFSNRNFMQFRYPHDGGTMASVVLEKINSITANQVYEFSGTYTPNRDVENDPVKARIDFLTISGAKIYIFDLKVTTSDDEYKKATLQYTADGFDSVVQAGSIISSINQSAESVSIEASKINLTGDVSLKGQFQAFDTSDVTNYIDMTAGAISVYNQGDNVFTVASTPLLGSRAGIFFGDVSDSSELLKHTHIDSTEGAFPWLYNRMTGTYEGRLGNTDTAYSVISAVFEGSIEFYQNVYFRSDEGGKVSCSMPAYFYDTVYDQSGSPVFVSDKRKKRSIKDLVIDKAKSFIMALKPRQFKFTKDISQSDRYHHGFIAQEVKEIMDGDWGVYCEDKETDFIGLRYDELIADMVAVIQDQEKRIEALERGLNDITNNQP